MIRRCLRPASPGRPLAGLVLAGLVLAGCGDSGTPPTTSPTPSPSPTSTSPAVPSPDPAAPEAAPSAPPAPGTVPPAWLGTRVLPVDEQGYGVRRPTPPELRHRRFTLPSTVPGPAGDEFWSQVETAPGVVLDRSTWAPGCPVGAGDLAWVRLRFWGFDDRPHLGELLVHRSVADDVVTVFRRLYRARFPIEEMRITRRDELDAPPTGDGNNTGAFVCRPKAGRTSGFSEHAYGLAVDVNPFQNPYLDGSLVLPELASSYLRRDRVRPGMVTPGDAVVRAFADIGWAWGGAWRTLKDYQHFSLHGR